MNDFENIRESFYSIGIGDDSEAVWVKKLRNILNTDIHNRPLGCRIDNTHIKIGDVHLSSFYEAQLLFSHAKWIHRFAEWLSCELGSENDKCLIVGYETYIEPVLSVLRNKRNLDYCIYEEPKYIQRNTMSKARLRYSEHIHDCIFNNVAYSKVIFLCGISSTLSTYKKLEHYFVSEFGEKIEDVKFLHFSIIQVLPMVNGKSEFLLNDANDKLEWNKAQKTVYRNSEIVVKYLVDVECEWQRAHNCKWCFPCNNYLDERPLITTGESSVIPLQMIGYNDEIVSESTLLNVKNDKIDLFEKENEEYKYIDYLYYNHIDRDDHHYQYYIRTGALFNKIMDESTSQDFVSFCSEIKNVLGLSINSINIIVTPMHFSNERFFHEVNRLVFDNKAHIISFDSRKEYRSNFETKYSNYAYVLEQIGSAIVDDDSGFLQEINFYFVDDQLITGNTFYKAKSFASSLMQKYSNKSNSMPKSRIFSAVITLIDRNSNSSKLNFVDNIDDFFSFINIPIPSIRSYGDSCPLCKEIIDAQNISDNCTLDVNSKYWKGKAYYHKKKTIEEAKKIFKKTTQYIKRRHFVRFYCECVIWNNVKHLWDEQSILSTILFTIYYEISTLEISEQYEYLISFLKVISRPFLFYRENVKKAVLKILLLILNELVAGNETPVNIVEVTIKKALEYRYILKEFKMDKVNINKIPNDSSADYERYCLVCVLISCLSNVESNYLLDGKHISALCDFVAEINSEYLRFSKIDFDSDIKMNGFYLIIVNSFKRLICGISGMEKTKAIEEQLISSFDGKYGELFKVLYLENIRHSIDDEVVDNKIIEIQDKQINTVLKYEYIGELCQASASVDSCSFFLSYGKEFKESKVAEIFANTHIGDFSLILKKMKYDRKEENVLYDCLYEVGYFEFNYQHFLFSIDDRLGEYKDNDNKTVLMLLSFNESDPNNYALVKKWLIHRKQIKKIIEGDIQTGALESAVRAKAAEYVLSTDKVQSHGHSNDIDRLFRFVYEKFLDARGKEEQTLVYAYQGINLFVNRCIAFGATKLIFQEYFNLNDAKSQLQPFSACMQNINNGCERDNVILDLKKYFEVIVNNQSVYIEEIIREVNNKLRLPNNLTKQEIKIALEDSFMEKIEKIEYVPLFINVSCEFAKSAVFLIGIIDVFIRNAIEHSPPICNIQLSCQLGEEVVEKEKGCCDFSNSYSITVSNNCIENDRMEEGFTQKFFTRYLFREKNKYSYFYITMRKNINNMFEAKLTCVIKDILEEN